MSVPCLTEENIAALSDKKKRARTAQHVFYQKVAGFGPGMHCFTKTETSLWVFRAAELLSTSGNLLLKNYVTVFLECRKKKRLVILIQRSFGFIGQVIP